MIPAPAEDLPAVDVDEQPARPLPGRDWDDTDLCLWRVDGQWSLHGLDGEIAVEGLGFSGTIPARDRAGAQKAAAAAITALTGRKVTGWDPDVSSRSFYGESSWYPWLER